MYTLNVTQIWYKDFERKYCNCSSARNIFWSLVSQWGDFQNIQPISYYPIIIILHDCKCLTSTLSLFLARLLLIDTIKCFLLHYMTSSQPYCIFNFNFAMKYRHLLVNKTKRWSLQFKVIIVHWCRQYAMTFSCSCRRDKISLLSILVLGKFVEKWLFPWKIL